MPPAFANTRRWMRHEVDFPVRVFARGISQAVPGRGTELSAGGMALYAGVELKTSQTLEVEFIAASGARVTGVVRFRQGYCFGLEFVTPLAIESDPRAQSPWPGTVAPTEPGPLARGAHELFQKIKAARGNAAAYALLSRVLTLAGRRDQARKAAQQALTFFQQDQAVLRQNRERRSKQLLQDLQALRELMLLLADAYDRGVLDPRVPGLLGSIPKLLGH